jgi:hypothetical protein
VAELTLSIPVSGLRVSTDPLEDAILLGLDGTGDDTLMVKKSDPEISGMWFGPRLGRRDRRSADEMQDDLEVVEVLRETPWALVPVKGINSHLRYPLDRRLGGPQNRSRRGGEEKNSQPPPGIEFASRNKPYNLHSLYLNSFSYIHLR